MIGQRRCKPPAALHADDSIPQTCLGDHDGSLTGYAGGTDKKIALLELEGTDMSDLYVPKKGTALQIII